jgi:hypothetical protein
LSSLNSSLAVQCLSKSWSFAPHPPLTVNYPVSALSVVDTLDTIQDSLMLKCCGGLPADLLLSYRFGFLPFVHVPHAENQEVDSHPLRIGSDIVISTMASEMVQEVPGNFPSVATVFCFCFLYCRICLGHCPVHFPDQGSLGSCCVYICLLFPPVWILSRASVFK